jgi:two-component system nitrate/nitrite response regulator NarL
MASAQEPISIMLVDDHQTMLWGLEKLIEGEASSMLLVGTASDSAAALALVERCKPQIVVLDLDLHGESSIDILPAIVGNGVSRVLILSGNRDRDLLSKAVRCGARGVVGKEAPASVVLDAIRKVHAGELVLDQALLGNLLGALINPEPAKRDPEADRIASLTAKERKIAALIAGSDGATNRELAQRAFISEQTLRNHLTTIYQKLGVANRLELYVYATRHQLDQTG